MRNASETVISSDGYLLLLISDYTTSSNDHRPRSMTCVCFAKPSSLGVTEPFLTQKTAFLSRSSEPVLEQNVTGFTFLSNVKSTKFSRLGCAGLLNLVPRGTKFSTEGY